MGLACHAKEPSDRLLPRSRACAPAFASAAYLCLGDTTDRWSLRRTTHGSEQVRRLVVPPCRTTRRDLCELLPLPQPLIEQNDPLIGQSEPQRPASVCGGSADVTQVRLDVDHADRSEPRDDRGRCRCGPGEGSCVSRTTIVEYGSSNRHDNNDKAAAALAIGLIGAAIIASKDHDDHPHRYDTPRPPPPSPSYVTCSSQDNRVQYCDMPLRHAKVDISRQLSRAPCVYRQSWGYDRRGIWVSEGCRPSLPCTDPVAR